MRALRRNRIYAAIAVGTIAIGIGAGTAVFSLARAVLRPLPYSVSAMDPLSYAVAACALVLAALAACAIPAFRATTVDPIVVLREE